MKCIKCNGKLIRRLRGGWFHIDRAMNADHIPITANEYDNLLKQLSYCKYGPVIFESFNQLTAGYYKNQDVVIIIHAALRQTEHTVEMVNDLIQLGVDNGFDVDKQLKMLKEQFRQL